MRDEEYVNNQCVALAAYVASCHKFNICIEWRSPDYCREISIMLFKLVWIKIKNSNQSEVDKGEDDRVSDSDVQNRK